MAGALLSVLLASSAEAQERATADWLVDEHAGAAARWPDLSRPPVVPAFLSAVIPGSGQLALGQGRGWLYLGLELAAWLGYADRRAAAATFRERYRDLAWERARTQGPPRQDAGFGYYETLTQWTRSGAFDRDAATSELQPETDPATFNGFIWERARGLFMSNNGGDGPSHPGYAAAVQYYRERAYDERFLWDWSDDPDAQRTFASLIDASDVRARQATTVLGLVIANHLIAAADGFLSARGLSGHVGPDTIRISWRTPR